MINNETLTEEYNKAKEVTTNEDLIIEMLTETFGAKEVNDWLASRAEKARDWTDEDEIEFQVSHIGAM
ncbi:MAG: hypothetical protein ACTSQE_07275 [Candidatus Heimdallarchaeaceae archaeon]